jgi:sigma-B regulation protein RsbU (phosphoserine phosphatase)
MKPLSSVPERVNSRIAALQRLHPAQERRRDMPDILNASRTAPPTVGLPQILAELPEMPRVELIEEQLTAVEREMDGLREEVESLRRRDRTVHFYMQRLDEEMRLAARLQQDFLPRNKAASIPLKFAALWRPAGYVSGDLYDVLRLDEEHVGFYIADAVGHGMPAALLTMFLKNALVTKEISGQSYRLLDPAEALSKLNDALVEQSLQAGTFCTACYGVLNMRSRELRLASAGHPAPMVLRGVDDPAVLHTQGALLGIFGGEKYSTFTHQLHAGDRLVFFTDGTEVCFNESADADPVRWREELIKRKFLGGEELVNDLSRYLDAESGSLDPRDDVTVLVAEVP